MLRERFLKVRNSIFVDVTALLQVGDIIFSSSEASLQVFDFMRTELVDGMSNEIWNKLADIVFKVKAVPTIRTRREEEDQ